jgi:hypothetical protein
MIPTASQKRNWYHRESIAETLRVLGLPAMMDDSHVVFRGHAVTEVVQWLAAASMPRLAGVMAHMGAGPRFLEAVEVFKAADQQLSIKHLVSPGVSFKGFRPMIDGAAIQFRFCTNAVDQGPVGYIVPVHRTAMADGDEWTELVAMVPVDAIERWTRLIEGAGMAMRHVMADPTTMQVYNGSDYEIQPINIDDIRLSHTVRTEFVDDVRGFLTRRDWYQARKLAWTRRYILNGPPGTGKTTLARWACSSLGLTPITLDFTDPYLDGRDFTRLMQLARRRAPSIVFFDDFEKVIGNNRSGISEHSILTTLSGSANLDGVIVLATTNSTDPFKGPMRRRFDKIVEFQNPGVDDLVEYMARMLRVDPIDWEAVKAHMGGRVVSFDDARAAVTAAANAAFASNRTSVTTDDMLRGLAGMAADRSQG